MDIPHISDEALSRYGIVPEDEQIHPHSPDHEWWNESYFWDWFDERGEWAGHCRFGMHPNQDRAWLWLFLCDGSEWVAIEEPRLPLSEVALPRLAYAGWGLDFAYEASDPLRAGALRCGGFGRVVSGPRAGMILPLGADLEIRALGPPHARSAGGAASHAAEGYATNRFEQPTAVQGTLRIDAATRDFQGRGQRDHSWGPRPWNMEWEFVVLNAARFRLQCAVVRIPGVPRIATGYLHRDTTVAIDAADFRLDYDDGCVTRPVSGAISVKAEDGGALSGSIESITAAEIDITHCFAPPRRSVYRRALVRFRPDDGSEPALGWLESNRFADSRLA
ncbi:MAG: hypothetical protein OEM05_02890 [Myxococcales bacterium]|nr:hypothetical protein [Myxococcales bacterium]